MQIPAINNDGAAPPPGILRVHLSDAEGKLRIGGGLDPGTPGPFQMRQCRIVLPVDIDWRALRLSAELEIKGVRHPVRWACREKLNPDGSLTGLQAPPEVPLELQPRLGKANPEIYPQSNLARREMSETDLPLSGLVGPVKIVGKLAP